MVMQSSDVLIECGILQSSPLSDKTVKQECTRTPSSHSHQLGTQTDLSTDHGGVKRLFSVFFFPLADAS